jgi:hypothetical protein
MVNEQQILNTITTANAGVTLAELLAQHPVLARRTAQRWISQWIAQGRLRAQGEGRARRYFAQVELQEVALASWAAALPLSPDSKDIRHMSNNLCQGASRWDISRNFCKTISQVSLGTCH